MLVRFHFLLLASLFSLTTGSEYLLKNRGCWSDNPDRAVPTLEGFSTTYYKVRTMAVQQCAKEAIKRGYSIMGVQDGGWCVGQQDNSDPLGTYQRHGESTYCGEEGKGGGWANQMYEIIPLSSTEVAESEPSYLGCWKGAMDDTAFTLDGENWGEEEAFVKCRNLASTGGYPFFSVVYELTPTAPSVFLQDMGCWAGADNIHSIDHLLEGHYSTRPNAIMQCMQAAKASGFTVFGVGYGGYCASSADAHTVFRSEGASTECGEEGKGRPGTPILQVYKIIE